MPRIVEKKRVAVIVQSSRGYGRDVLTGIASYARAHRTWSIYHDERVLTDVAPEWLKGWQGHGIIASFENDELTDFARSTRIPAVDLHGEYRLSGVPCVAADSRQAIQLAYNHLRGLGFHRVAYCGFQGIRYSDEREEILRKLAEQDGIELTVLDSPYPHVTHTSRIEADGFLHQHALSEWLATLRPPTGIVACNDIRAAQVLHATREYGVSVPDDFAVIGIDNDQFVCGLCDPPLSSVDLNAVRVGFSAAEMLDALMNGKPVKDPYLRVAPAGIVVRESTNRMSVQDEDIAHALRFIHDRASEGIGVEDVVTEVSISRSTLERRFRRLVGCSVKAEINRVRLMRLKDLLASCDYPLDRVAEMVGFAHATYMIDFFRKSVGMTPGEYRREHSEIVG